MPAAAVVAAALLQHWGELGFTVVEHCFGIFGLPWVDVRGQPNTGALVVVVVVLLSAI